MNRSTFSVVVGTKERTNDLCKKVSLYLVFICSFVGGAQEREEAPLVVAR